MYTILSIADDMYVDTVHRDGSMCLSMHPQEFKTKKLAENAIKRIRKAYGNRPFRLEFTRKEGVYKKLTYNQLLKKANKIYSNMSVHSSFCAEFEARDYIAQHIDECVDANRNPKAKKVRAWYEYHKYAPLKRSEYEARKKAIRKRCRNALAALENEWATKGKGNPNFHKI
mgnify:FL=1